MSLLRVVGITKKFGNHIAVDSVSLDFEQGKLTALLGESGCGKTTLLRLIAGLEKADAGQILLEGKDITQVEPQRRGIGMVFQDFALFPHLTVKSNVGFGLKRRDENRIKEVLEQVGLTKLANRYPHELSGGQQQRVALARALAPSPKVLLLDEPFSNLDPSLKERMTWELRELLTGTTAIMVTHDARDTLAIADKIALMHKGKIAQSGTPEEIYTQPKNSYVASFFGTANFFEGWQLRKWFPEQWGNAQDGLWMVRAEDVILERGTGKSTILSKNYLGGRWLVWVDLEEKKICAYLAQSNPPQEKELCKVFVAKATPLES